MKLVSSHLLGLVVASSYLTLGVSAPATARGVWWEYGLVSFVLAVVNYSLTKGRDGRSPHR